MAQTVDQIEAEINRTRASLGSNLRELEHKVEVAADWREHFRTRPWVVLGAAGVCGFVVGALLTPETDEGGPVQRGMARSPVVGQLSPLFDDIAEALVAVATSSVKGVIDNMVPGFRDHLARIEERASSR